MSTLAPDANLFVKDLGRVTAGSPEGRKEQARRRADAIRETVSGHIELVALAVEERDWELLGYPDLKSWYSYVASEANVKATIRKRLTEALRAEGWSFRRIAGELEVSKTTVAREVSRNGTPPAEDQPGRVTGSDGKTYPARHPKPVTPKGNPTSFAPMRNLQRAAWYLGTALEALNDLPSPYTKEQLLAALGTTRAEALDDLEAITRNAHAMRMKILNGTPLTFP
jgi:hypothetical protein